MTKKKSAAVVIVPHDDWIALTMALETSPDISIETLIGKAKRLVENRKKYAQQVVKLEDDLLKKCPELDS